MCSAFDTDLPDVDLDAPVLTREQTPPGGMTYAAIAQEMGITKEGVRVIEARALRKLAKKAFRLREWRTK